MSQGRQEPLPAFIQKGSQGLGFGPSGSGTESAGHAANARHADSGQEGGPKRSGPSVAERMAVVAKAELAGESLPVKVKRHRQVAR